MYMIALKHLVQMGVRGTHNKILTEFSKETWITCNSWHGTFREVIFFKKNLKKSASSTKNPWRGNINSYCKIPASNWSIWCSGNQINHSKSSLTIYIIFWVTVFTKYMNLTPLQSSSHFLYHIMSQLIYLLYRIKEYSNHRIAKIFS